MLTDASGKMSPVSAVTTSPGEGLPTALAQIVEEFQGLTLPDRLQLLLELSEELPALPPRLEGRLELMERIDECQSPAFVEVELTSGVAQLHFSVPREAPTTRGFAAILSQGLSGLSARELLGVPDDVGWRLGLTQAVSPLRMRGLAGMLARAKRQTRAALAVTP